MTLKKLLLRNLTSLLDRDAEGEELSVSDDSAEDLEQFIEDHANTYDFSLQWDGDKNYDESDTDD
ncbi:LOW QUALITY PROTEIN: hypothetical protein PHPALM_30982 [Phytophthora palmivora]|uniref:Uncharacterized protein n=1 Tax=Phytophthora palmivora TaxID=4796 RepID=A0A2P4X3Q8_9STRA|nr:LOW QUALITY PROTEIN: hypothetical protein PHPALM_30982 [Phytophthora palmivora]